MGGTYLNGYSMGMNTARALRDARRQAGLTQTALGARAGTSQATISAYERAHKRPSVETLGRLLAATGLRLTVERAARPVVEPSAAQHARTARALNDVLALAEVLPSRPGPELRFPRLPHRDRHGAA